MPSAYNRNVLRDFRKYYIFLTFLLTYLRELFFLPYTVLKVVNVFTSFLQLPYNMKDICKGIYTIGNKVKSACNQMYKKYVYVKLPLANIKG